MPRSPSPSPRPAAKLQHLLDRLVFRLSRSRCIDGLWIGCFFVDDHSRAFGRVEAALSLIKTYDPLRYRRLIRDVERIWVSLIVGGGLGQFRHSLKSCDLDERFVLADSTQLEQIATAIVHEATHARLMRCGIGYELELRSRVEAVCFRRELAFASRLPNGEQIREEGESRLTGYSPDYWANDAFRDRFEQGSAEALRYLGRSEFFIRTVFGIRVLLQRIRRHLQRLKRIFRGRQ